MKRVLQWSSFLLALVLLVCTLPVTAWAATTVDLSHNYLFRTCENAVSFAAGQTVTMTFTPQYTADYTLQLRGYNNGEKNIKASLTAPDGTVTDFEYPNRTGTTIKDYSHPYLTATLEQGKTYTYSVCGFTDSTTGSVDVTLTSTESGTLSQEVGLRLYLDQDQWTTGEYSSQALLNAMHVLVVQQSGASIDWRYKNAGGGLTINDVDLIVDMSACGSLGENTLVVYYMGYRAEAKFQMDSHTHIYGDPEPDYAAGSAYVEGKATHTATCTGEGTCNKKTKTEPCVLDNGVVTRAATCTADGLKAFTCSQCGGTTTVVLPATGHSWSAWSRVDGTEGEAAQHQRVCTNDASHVETAACSFTAKIVQEATVDQPELTQYTCAVCGYAYTAQTKPPHTHDYQPTQVVTPTCTAGGYTVYSCTVCGDEVHRDETQALGHDYTAQVIAQPTCTAYGKTKYTCTRCGDSYTVSNIKPKGHSYKSQLTKATTGKDGQSYKKCTVCGAITGKTVIPKASNIYLSKTAFTYNGKVQRPTVTVKDSKGKTLKNGTDYTVSYSSGCKNVGKFTVKVTLKGNYSGSKSMTYNINPKGTSVSKVTAAKKGFKVTWKKQATQTTGYQVQYSTNKNFKKGNKTVTVSKNKTTTKSVSKLSAKKKYYVRVRTYKTVKINGKNVKLYSGWSKAKSVTTKK